MERVEGAAAQPWRGRRRAMGFSAVLGVVLAGTTLLLPYVPYPLESGVTIAMAATLVVFVLLRMRDKRVDWFEILLPVGVMYIVYFGLGALHMKANPNRMFNASLMSHVTPALGVAFVGFIAMMIGYCTMFRNTRPSPGLAVEPTGGGMVVLGAVGAAGTLATISQIANVTGGGRVSVVLNTLTQLEPMFMLAWAVGWYMFWAKRLDGRGKLALFGVLLPAVAAVAVLTVGGKQRILLILLMPMMARWYAKKRMPWVGITTLILLAVFVVFPIYNTFREQSRDLGTMTRVDRAFNKVANSDADKYMDDAGKKFMDRMAIVSSVAAILRDCPDPVPYRYGETLALAPVSLLIPRMLWPDKPNISIGREFAETFGLIAAFDRETLIAPSIVGDFYWNFALPGVFVGMLLVGAGMRWTYQRYGAGWSYTPMRKALYLTLFMIITSFEQNFAILFAVTVKTILLVLIAVYLLKRFGLVRELPQAA